MFAAPFVAQIGVGHQDGVYCLAKDLEATDRLASASGDGIVKIWDLPTREETQKAKVHDVRVFLATLCFLNTRTNKPGHDQGHLVGQNPGGPLSCFGTSCFRCLVFPALSNPPVWHRPQHLRHERCHRRSHLWPRRLRLHLHLEPPHRPDRRRRRLVAHLCLRPRQADTHHRRDARLAALRRHHHRGAPQPGRDQPHGHLRQRPQPRLLRPAHILAHPQDRPQLCLQRPGLEPAGSHELCCRQRGLQHLPCVCPLYLSCFPCFPCFSSVSPR